MKISGDVYNDIMKTIFSTVVGSRLYGTFTSESDWDYKAVALPSAEDLLGLEDNARKHWDNVPTPNDKPGETVVYSVTKFLSLFMSGNPTVTELVFVDPSFYADTVHPVWDEVRHVAIKYLLSRKIIGSYSGYIHDQFTRVKLRKAQNNREVMIEKHGYDIKCANHVFRLAIQGHSLITTGSCNPTLTGDDLAVCRSIRSGEKTYNEIMDILEKKLAWFEEGCKQNVLPTVDVDEMKSTLNKYLIDLHGRVVESYLTKKGEYV